MIDMYLRSIGILLNTNTKHGKIYFLEIRNLELLLAVLAQVKQSVLWFQY